jgi:GMP synthase-like glutamine amidotransferase
MKEIGWYDVTLTEEGSKDPFFSHLPSTFPVFQWHEDTFEIPKSGKLIATSSPVSHQAFRYGENVYGLQFHLEVTEDMIIDWVETYEEEFKAPQVSRPFSKTEVMTETEIKIETYIRRGMRFLENFFRKTAIH